MMRLSAVSIAVLATLGGCGQPAQVNHIVSTGYTGTPVTDAMWKRANGKPLTDQEQAMIAADDKQHEQEHVGERETYRRQVKARQLEQQTAERAAKDLSSAQARRDAGKRLTARDTEVLAQADAEVAKRKQRAELDAELDARAAAQARQQHAAQADQAQCEYEAQAATVDYGGYQPSLAGYIGAAIGQGAQYNNLLRMCLNARAVGRM